VLVVKREDVGEGLLAQQEGSRNAVLVVKVSHREVKERKHPGEEEVELGVRTYREIPEVLKAGNPHPADHPTESDSILVILSHLRPPPNRRFPSLISSM
jgi:hypothetical protein